MLLILSSNQNLGSHGEALAAKWLQEQYNFKILHQNWRYGSYCELDIVAVDPNTDPQTLVAVEVKTRLNDKYGRGYLTITPKKIASLTRSIRIFAIQNKDFPQRLRIDAVDIMYEGTEPNLKYFRDVR